MEIFPLGIIDQSGVLAMMTVSLDTYIQILENEVDVLRAHYYKPNEEGTGHYNTAISVLEHRINELKKEKIHG